MNLITSRAALRPKPPSAGICGVTRSSDYPPCVGRAQFIKPCSVSRLGHRLTLKRVTLEKHSGVFLQPFKRALPRRRDSLTKLPALHHATQTARSSPRRRISQQAICNKN
eukprot:6471073-Amphidinium_carterae.1